MAIIKIPIIMCCQIPGTSSMVQRKWRPLQSTAQTRELGPPAHLRISVVAAEIKQIKTRRKTARMLMVVLLVFALCYLPISILNILKRYFHVPDLEILKINSLGVCLGWENIFNNNWVAIFIESPLCLQGVLDL